MDAFVPSKVSSLNEGASVNIISPVDGLAQDRRQAESEFNPMFHHTGLSGVLQQIMPQITTPFVMLVEHDWFFQGPAISLTEVLRTLSGNPVL